jgi:beta-galactosidase
LISEENHITYPVVIRHGTNDYGRTIRYYLNYSDKSASIVYSSNKGTNLFSNSSLKKGDEIMIDPWGVVIVEE